MKWSDKLEKVMLKNYPYFKGRHCASTSITEISKFFNNNISEPVALGLGSGAYFSCVNFTNYLPRFLGTRSPMYEIDFFKNIECDLKWIHGDEAFSWNKIMNYLDEGIPILMHTDIFYLDFYNVDFSNIGPHTLVLTGYEDLGDFFYVSDYISNKPMKISRKSLYLSLCKQSIPFNYKKVWAPIENFNINLDKAIKKSILKNSMRMLDASNNFGVNNIKRTSEEVLMWNDLPNWGDCCLSAFKALEKIGSGGSGFRVLYRDFITEIAK